MTVCREMFHEEPSKVFKTLLLEISLTSGFLLPGGIEMGHLHETGLSFSRDFAKPQKLL